MSTRLRNNYGTLGSTTDLTDNGLSSGVSPNTANGLSGNSRWSEYDNDNHYPPNSPFSFSNSSNFNNQDPFASSRDSFASVRDVPSTSEKFSAAPKSAWLQSQQKSSSRSRTTLYIAMVAFALLVAGGITAGVVVSKKNGDTNPVNLSGGNTNATTTSTSTNSTSSLIPIPGTAGVVLSNPDDPSDFQKDSRLYQSFWGIAYTPFNAQYPWCGSTLANVTEDIQLLSQMTTRLRTYGSDCNQTDFILHAIQLTKANISVWPGVWVDGNETTWVRQTQETIWALQTYGYSNVPGIIVGNEVILDADPNVDDSTARNAAIAELKMYMDYFKGNLTAVGIDLPVGTADAGAEITTTLAEECDFVMANVHPYFGGVPIDQAAGWTWQYYTDTDLAATKAASNNPPCYIAETGWPSQSMNSSDASDGAAVAGVTELQEFLDTFVCAANVNQTGYFFFEAFDEPWKEEYGGVEPYWGIFDSNKVLKNVTMPNCSHV